jgi:hypothetical protein
MKPEKNITPAKLADDHGYRVAAEAFRIAASLGCSESLYEALFEIVKREAKRLEADQQ